MARDGKMFGDTGGGRMSVVTTWSIKETLSSTLEALINVEGRRVQVSVQPFSGFTVNFRSLESLQ